MTKSLKLIGIIAVVLLHTIIANANGDGKFFKEKGFAIEDELQSGDIIFQILESGQGLAVQLATKSKYSHVGIILEKKGELYVLEAIQPVQETPLKEWIKRGKNNHYVVKRLKNADKVVTEQVIKEMKKIEEDFIHTNYDIYFGWDDNLLYCSELVFKLYERTTGIEIGELKVMGDYDLSHPEVKRLMTQRYGQNPPLEEPMISPGSMFDSPLLFTVMQN